MKLIGQSSPLPPATVTGNDGKDYQAAQVAVILAAPQVVGEIAQATALVLAGAIARGLGYKLVRLSDEDGASAPTSSDEFPHPNEQQSAGEPRA